MGSVPNPTSASDGRELNGSCPPRGLKKANQVQKLHFGHGVPTAHVFTSKIVSVSPYMVALSRLCYLRSITGSAVVENRLEVLGGGD